MPINMQYDKDTGVLIAKLTGTVSLEEMQEYTRQLLTSDDIPSNTNALWDVSDMSFNNITYEFEQSLVEFRKKYDEQRGKAKIAILTTSALAEPLVKLYTILSKELSQNTQVFTSGDLAMHWLTEES